MRGAYSTHHCEINAYKLLVRKFEDKSILGRRRYKWKDNM
jgi:hypothetical protein